MNGSIVGIVRHCASQKVYHATKKTPAHERAGARTGTGTRSLHFFAYPTGSAGAGATGKRAGRDPKRVIMTAPRPARPMTKGASQPTQGSIWIPSATRVKKKVPSPAANGSARSRLIIFVK